MVYGTFLGGGEDGDSQAGGGSWLRVSARVAAAGGLVGACCLAATSPSLGGGAEREWTSLEHQPQVAARSNAILQQLSQTSARTDLAHPYGSMYPANPTFISPTGGARQAVNSAPHHPYHNGVRPKQVLNEDFEHAPFGNHLPWEQGPEGALAKYHKDTGRMTAYRYMVDKNGVVQRWESQLHKSDVDGRHIGEGSLRALSPLAEPGPGTTDVAAALVKVQLNNIRRSFRDIAPRGAFHDSVVDSQSGRALYVPDTSYGAHHVDCPAGLVLCQDHSCVASMSYCPGCQERPMPEYCAANAAKPSGWMPSMIGCENQTQVANCGMTSGQGLFLPGEAVTGGFIGGGLA